MLLLAIWRSDYAFWVGWLKPSASFTFIKLNCCQMRTTRGSLTNPICSGQSASRSGRGCGRAIGEPREFGAIAAPGAHMVFLSGIAQQLHLDGPPPVVGIGLGIVAERVKMGNIVP